MNNLYLDEKEPCYKEYYYKPLHLKYLEVS